MSVRVSERGVSQTEFKAKAHELERFVTRMVSNPKIIPKSYRLTLGMTLLGHAQRLNRDVIIANKIKVRTQSDALTRISLQESALNELTMLEERMIIASELLPIRATVKARCAMLIEVERKTLTGWMTSDKQRYKAML